MTQHFMHADDNKWWCTLCPENYNTSPGISGTGHFEMCHTVEELYDPNRPPFRGSWPETKKELLDRLTNKVDSIREQINPIDKQIFYEIIEKLKTTL